MALDDTDRRRFVYAAILSLLALPALWWVNRDEGTPGPKVATAGVEVGSNADTSPTPPNTEVAASTTIGRSNLPPTETVGESPPIFLDGPVGNVGGAAQIAVPVAPEAASIITEATFRGSISDTRSCLATGIQPGRTVTVVNLDNNRSTTCLVRLAPANQIEDLVMHTDLFIELADLTDAPIPVEIRP